MARILIAEDDSRTAEEMQTLLAAQSHTPMVARSGQEAIVLLKSYRFDLVMTDLMMEGGTGLDVLEWIRSNAQDVPVLICSSYMRPESLRPHLVGLRHRLVKKPFEPDEMLGLVRELLDDAQGPDSRHP